MDLQVPRDWGWTSRRVGEGVGEAEAHPRLPPGVPSWCMLCFPWQQHSQRVSAKQLQPERGKWQNAGPEVTTVPGASPDEGQWVSGTQKSNAQRFLQGWLRARPESEETTFRSCLPISRGSLYSKWENRPSDDQINWRRGEVVASTVCRLLSFWSVSGFRGRQVRSKSPGTGSGRLPLFPQQEAKNPMPAKCRVETVRQGGGGSSTVQIPSLSKIEKEGQANPKAPPDSRSGRCWQDSLAPALPSYEACCPWACEDLMCMQVQVGAAGCLAPGHDTLTRAATARKQRPLTRTHVNASTLHACPPPFPCNQCLVDLILRHCK